MHGADMMYSEFISSEEHEAMELFFDYERPVGIQIFEGDEEAMALSKIVTTVRPDIDINFGCPVKSGLQRRWCWCAKRCGFDDSFN
jgi:tRNA-dihydrouridine synthase